MAGKEAKPFPRRSILNPGIATSEKGQEAVRTILAAARSVLTYRGRGCFSIRNIAAEANMHVSHVYYYFPDKIGLLRGVIQEVIDHYTHDLEARIINKEMSDERRFLNLIDVLLNDMRQPENRLFFTQLWALLTSDAKLSENYLESFFAGYRNRIFQIVEPLNPQLDPRTRQRRAALIAALMEGSLLLLGSGVHQDTDLDGIEDDIRKLALRIAKAKSWP